MIFATAERAGLNPNKTSKPFDVDYAKLLKNQPINVTVRAWTNIHF